MPPTRRVRYCCDVLKERGGKGRIVSTGVRWSESNSRKKTRGVVEVIASKRKNSLILLNDNDENRRMFETCAVKGKRVVNPIIDWTDNDVWEFLHHYGCDSNPLYQCGFNRVGCIGCPIVDQKRIFEFERYPKIKENYIRSFDRMVKTRINDGLKTEWNSGEEVFQWWMKPYVKTNSDQIKFDFEEED
jgi:phosphoadenosine phosphosulfate reductase